MLETALALIIRDLRSTEGIALRVSEEPVDNDPSHESCWLLAGDGSRTGLFGYRNLAESELLTDVADRVQDFVLEELGRLGLPATWPECPEHPASHPLRPTLKPSGPHWLCPKSGDTVARIGEL